MDIDALITQLQAMIATQSKLLEAQAIQLEKLTEQVEQLLRKLYGKKSEKKPTAKPIENALIVERKTQPLPEETLKPKRARLPEYIERVDVIVDISETEKTCKACHNPLQRIGERVSERLDFIPAKLIVKRHVCYKWACACGQGGVKTASLPNQAIEKGIAGPGLLAEVLVSKYQDAMPLYRQMLRFKRLGFEISDSTMGDWVAECAFLLKPLVDVMREDLKLSKKLHTDDTPVPVLAKGKTKQARLWVYLADTSAPYPMCIYDYTPTRSSKGPLEFLRDYRGYLQADAYSGYNKL